MKTHERIQQATNTLRAMLTDGTAQDTLKDMLLGLASKEGAGSMTNIALATIQLNTLLAEAGVPQADWPAGLGKTAGLRAWGKKGLRLREPGEFQREGENMPEAMRKGLAIRAPMFAYLDKDGKRVSWKKATEGGKIRHGFSKELVAFKTVFVFSQWQMAGDTEDTTGANLSDPEGIWNALCAVAEEEGYSVKLDAQGKEGGFVTKDNVIRVNPAQNLPSRVHVLGHELAHKLLGHTEEENTEENRARQEAEAELSAGILSACLGSTGHLRATSAYLLSWKVTDQKLLSLVGKAGDLAKRVIQAMNQE